jgi:cell wall-associated NlpC family hydrolase
MPRPTPANLAMIRSNLPARRVSGALPVASARPSNFAALLQRASSGSSSGLQKASTSTSAARGLPQRSALLQRAQQTERPSVNPTSPNGPAPQSRSEMIDKAKSLMGIPYVWGGNSGTGLDCSAFVSKVWGLSRQTTDTLGKFSKPISKEELRTGDALNLTTSEDPDRGGHIRLFDKWANPEKTKMWVYEETPPRSVHHIINWDPSYTPIRRINTVD